MNAILTIDTANGYLALGLKNSNEIGHFHKSEKINHQVEEICGAVSQLLQTANEKLENIEYFGLNIGPGSFTGVRIATAYITGLLAFSPEKKIILFDTFDILLQEFLINNPGKKNSKIAVALKADILNNIFIKHYDFSENYQSIGKFMKINEIQPQECDILLCDEDIFPYLSAFSPVICNKISPSTMLKLAENKQKSAQSLAEIKLIQPQYIRQPYEK